MATSITTFSGLRCTMIRRTQFFTTSLTSPAVETAGLPNIVSTITISATQESSSSITSSTSSTPQSTDSSTTSSPTSLAITVTSASSTITASATILPVVAPSSTDPIATQSSSASITENSSGSKINIIAAAVGASLGTVVVVALVILCAYFRRRKKHALSHIDDREKENSTSGPFSGFAPVIGRLRQGLSTTIISSPAAKIRAAVAGLRNPRSIFQNTNERRNISSPINPFADPPPGISSVLSEGDPRSENPFADPIEPPSGIAHDDQSTSPPVIMTRSGVGNINNVDTTNNNNINHNNTQRIPSSSTFNISNTRASSTYIPSERDSWDLDQKPEDRISTYSDPFDLEGSSSPIQSYAYLAPMVD